MFPAAGPIGLGIGAIGALGPLLFGGGSQVVNPYEPEANQNYGQATQDAEQLSNFGKTETQGAEAFSPEQQQILQQFLAALRMPLNTNTQAEAAFNRSSGNAAQGWENAKSNLISQLAQRGIVAPQGASSELAGGEADIAAQQAGSSANIENQNAWQMLQTYLQNLMTANQAATGQEQMLTGAGEGGLESGGQMADTTGNDYLNMGQQQIENTMNANQIQNQEWGSLANLGGMMAGLGYGGGKTPSTASPTSGANPGNGVTVQPPANGDWIPGEGTVSPVVNTAGGGFSFLAPGLLNFTNPTLNSPTYTGG